MALVPPAVATVTFTAPPRPGGEVAVIEPSGFTVNAVAAVLPNITLVAPVNAVPVMVTVVPPVVGPEAGLTPVTVGAGGGGPVLMFTFWTYWTSLKPPVAPVNPTSTWGGSAVA